MVRLGFVSAKMWGSLSRISRCYASNSLLSPYICVRLGSTLPVNLGTSELNEDLKPKFEKRSAFVNDLFLGKYDVNVLTFPEVLEPDALKTLEGQVNLLESFFRQEVDSQIINSERCIPESTLEGLKEIGLFGMRAPSSCHGMNLNATEYARLKEVIAQESSIAEILHVHGDLGLQSVLLACNPVVNNAYLKDLASGKLTATVCLSENYDGTDVSSIRTTAKLSEDGETWILNGTKKFVKNASSAGIFIVIAQTGVSFKNTPVPNRNLLSNVNSGLQFIRDVLSGDMYSYGSSGIAILKKLLKLATESSINKQYFGRSLQDFGSVKKKVAELCLRIYAIESLTYLTAGLLDSCDFVDCRNESSIVKIFTSENVLRSMDECQELFGHEAYMTKCPFEQMLSDTRASTVPEESNVNLRSALILAGLQNAGFTHPATSQSSWRRLYERLSQDNDRPLLDLKLHYYVHPTLEFAAKQLEYCVKRFQYALEILISRHGNSIIDHDIELCRLADLVVNIYAMTAVLGRASRSYCIGLQDSDYEVLLASTFCSRTLAEVKRTMNNVLHGPVGISDPSYLKVTRKVIECKQYFLRNPSTPNI
ncbi:complex I assembly factor ACAD9, mitochondrial isoform X2 [Anabrus simplex]|uniref:complex I assembly factor ACAD9, mitochondrial isoform X2 n=1 Tax=Anabrus simplex TaxID=316456 RepID=UPI0035A28F00